MANMYNINGLSYTTKENPEWFTRAMFGGRLVQGGYVRVLTGIKGDELLSQIDLENKILQIDGKDCAWTPNQIIKLSEKKASVKTYKINLEECIDTLENKRTLYQLSDGAKNDALPADLEAATLALIAIGLSNEIEEMLVGGSEATDPNQFNGMERTLALSSEATKIVGPVLSAANVLAQMAIAYDAVKEDVLQSEDAGTLFAYVSYATRRKIRNALSTLNNQVVAALWTIDDADKKNPKLYYNGMEIVPVKGIGVNTIIVIDAGNAYLLTDLLSDLEDVEMGQFPAPNDSKVFIKGRLRLGFVIPFEDEAVIVSPDVVAQAGGDNSAGLRLVPNSLVFSAEGETKTATVITEDDAAVIELSANPVGYTVTAGATVAGVTTLTIVSTPNTGMFNPKVGQIVVSIVDTNRSGVITLDTHSEEVVTIVE